MPTRSLPWNRPQARHHDPLLRIGMVILQRRAGFTGAGCALIFLNGHCAFLTFNKPP